MRHAVFLLSALFCLTPAAGAPTALALGLVLALLGFTAWDKPARKLSRLLIQLCIVLLGFSIDLADVARAGAAGTAFAAATIFGTFALGLALARLLRTEPQVTMLLCSGTAICGGSAIAATGSVIRASDATMSVALAAVFSLNAVALYAFPPIGHALALSQHQFGTWAAVAIHDMSSVVGAGRVYGDEALATATVVKLSRVLWIVPVSILAGWVVARAGRRPDAPGDAAATPAPAGIRWASIVPWFIALFVAASCARTLFPALSAPGLDWSWGAWGGGGRWFDVQHIDSPADLLKAVAKQGMVLALFLIGCGLSRSALASVGWRPFVLAVVLWVAISVASLVVVLRTIA